MAANLGYFEGIFVEGPRAGRYHADATDTHTVEGFTYKHRLLVRFRNGQSFGAWVPPAMTNSIALQRIFDGYVEAKTGNG